MQILSSTTFKRIGVAVGHGRMLTVGQIWQSNDPRRLRAVRVVRLMYLEDDADVIVENVVTGVRSVIAAKNFTVGSRGWSLLQEVKWPS